MFINNVFFSTVTVETVHVFKRVKFKVFWGQLEYYKSKLPLGEQARQNNASADKQSDRIILDLSGKCPRRGR